ncbi:Hypothetical predicted protein, partial [Marmota monax]
RERYLFTSSRQPRRSTAQGCRGTSGRAQPRESRASETHGISDSAPTPTSSPPRVSGPPGSSTRRRVGSVPPARRGHRERRSGRAPAPDAALAVPLQVRGGRR